MRAIVAFTCLLFIIFVFGLGVDVMRFKACHVDAPGSVCLVGR